MINKYLFFILLLSISEIRWLNDVFAAPSFEQQRYLRGSTTTICVEIKPNTPQEEPFYMCKEADLQLNQKRPNDSSETVKPRLYSAPDPNDNKFQSFRSKNNDFPEKPFWTTDSKSEENIQKKPFYTFSNGPAEIHSALGLRKSSPSTSQKNTTEAGYRQTIYPATSHGTANNGCTHSGGYRSHTGCEHRDTISHEYQRDRYSSQLPSTNRFQSPNNDKPSGTVFKSSDNESQRNSHQNGRDFEHQSSYEPDRKYPTENAHGQFYIPDNRVLATGQGTYSQDFPTGSRKTTTNTNDSSIKITPSSRAEDPSPKKKPFSQLEDDVLGIPNWNFSLGEYNILSGLENPIAITNQENYPQQERTLEEIDYIDDPVMRTFYESFQNNPSEIKLRNHLLGESYSTPATPTPLMPEKSSPPSPQKEAVPSSDCLNNKDVFGPYMYQPIVISMPCCHFQNGPDHTINNNGKNQNVGESMLGSPLTQYLGLEKPSPFQNFLSFFNTGLHNLLGAPNPMYNQFHPLNHYNQRASNLLQQNHQPVPHFQHPMYLPFPYTPTYQYPPQSLLSLQPSLQLANREYRPEVNVQNQNLQEHANMASIGQDQVVSFPNPLKFLTKMPDVVKNVQEKIEKHFEGSSSDFDKSPDNINFSGKQSLEKGEIEIVNGQPSTTPIITKPDIHHPSTTEVSTVNISTNATAPAALINSKEQEDNKFIDYTLKARSLAHKSKDSWTKRSNLFSTLRKDENSFEQTP